MKTFEAAVEKHTKRRSLGRRKTLKIQTNISLSEDSQTGLPKSASETIKSSDAVSTEKSTSKAGDKKLSKKFSRFFRHQSGNVATPDPTTTEVDKLALPLVAHAEQRSISQEKNEEQPLDHKILLDDHVIGVHDRAETVVPIVSNDKSPGNDNLGKDTKTAYYSDVRAAVVRVRSDLALEKAVADAQQTATSSIPVTPSSCYSSLDDKRALDVFPSAQGGQTLTKKQLEKLEADLLSCRGVARSSAVVSSAPSTCSDSNKSDENLSLRRQQSGQESSSLSSEVVQALAGLSHLASHSYAPILHPHVYEHGSSMGVWSGFDAMANNNGQFSNNLAKACPSPTLSDDVWIDRMMTSNEDGYVPDERGFLDSDTDRRTKDMFLGDASDTGFYGYPTSSELKLIDQISWSETSGKEYYRCDAGYFWGNDESLANDRCLWSDPPTPPMIPGNDKADLHDDQNAGDTHLSGREWPEEEAFFSEGAICEIVGRDAVGDTHPLSLSGLIASNSHAWQSSNGALEGGFEQKEETLESPLLDSELIRPPICDLKRTDQEEVDFIPDASFSLSPVLVRNKKKLVLHALKAFHRQQEAFVGHEDEDAFFADGAWDGDGKNSQASCWPREQHQRHLDVLHSYNRNRGLWQSPDDYWPIEDYSADYFLGDAPSVGGIQCQSPTLSELHVIDNMTWSDLEEDEYSLNKPFDGVLKKSWSSNDADERAVTSNSHEVPQNQAIGDESHGPLEEMTWSEALGWYLDETQFSKPSSLFGDAGGEVNDMAKLPNLNQTVDGNFQEVIRETCLLTGADCSFSCQRRYPKSASDLLVQDHGILKSKQFDLHQDTQLKSTSKVEVDSPTGRIFASARAIHKDHLSFTGLPKEIRLMIYHALTSSVHEPIVLRTGGISKPTQFRFLYFDHPFSQLADEYQTHPYLRGDDFLSRILHGTGLKDFEPIANVVRLSQLSNIEELSLFGKRSDSWAWAERLDRKAPIRISETLTVVRSKRWTLQHQRTLTDFIKTPVKPMMRSQSLRVLLRLGLLAVNKQIYNELLPIVYGNGTFGHNFLTTYHLRNFFHSVNLDSVRSITSVTLTMHGEPSQCRDSVLFCLKGMNRLKKLHLCVRANGDKKGYGKADLIEKRRGIWSLEEGDFGGLKRLRKILGGMQVANVIVTGWDGRRCSLIEEWVAGAIGRRS